MVDLPHGFPDGARLPDVVVELGERFESAGFELALVGGPVRDLFLGRVSPDLDFTTDADPDQILGVVRPWADAVWEIGRDFGTIGLRRADSDGDHQLEVTTYRAEAYDAASRKPEVRFGKDLGDDLVRRDFTVNAMALRLPSLELVDPHGGVRDLVGLQLRTPPLPRSRSRTTPAHDAGCALRLPAEPRRRPEVREAMTQMAERLEIVSAERIQVELVKLISGESPRWHRPDGRHRAGGQHAAGDSRAEAPGR